MVDGVASDSQYSVAVLNVFRLSGEAKKKEWKRRYNFAIAQDHEAGRESLGEIEVPFLIFLRIPVDRGTFSVDGQIYLVPANPVVRGFHR